jgi:hypothetical protein
VSEIDNTRGVCRVKMVTVCVAWQRDVAAASVHVYCDNIRVCASLRVATIAVLEADLC